MLLRLLALLIIAAGLSPDAISSVRGDTWITLWNKLDEPLRIHCMREGAKKLRSFKSKTVDADDRYDIKG